MTYAEATGYLYGLLGHGVKLGLENIQTLLQALEHPELKAPSVLIGGTNGKGSVAALVASALRAKGLRVGGYTSPHLLRYEERIAIDGQPLAPARVAALTERLKAVTERLRHDGSLRGHPTFFETTTALGWLAFEQAGCDVVVTEVGLGGRFDATNASSPCASAITTIGLEHTRYLGHTVEEIAMEKAGVMRSGKPVVTGSDDPRVLDVLASQATQRGALLYRAADEVATPISEPTATGSRLKLTTERASYGPLLLPLTGRHQLTNARVALALLERLPDQLRPTPDQIVRGFENTRWPGRLERYAGRPEILLDGAHNPHAGAALATHLREFEPRARTLVFAAVEDKDVGAMAKLLFPLFDNVVLTRLSCRRSIDPESMLGLAVAGTERHITDDTAEALKLARSLTPGDDLIVVAGSLYLVGEAKACLEGLDSPMRDTAQ